MQTTSINDMRSKAECPDDKPQSPYAPANVRGVLAYYVFSRILSGISGVLFVILLVRHMAVIDYSNFATTFGAAGIIGILSSLGTEKAVTRFVPEGRIQQRGKALSRLIWRLLGLRTIILLVMTVVAVGCWTYYSPDRTYSSEISSAIALVIIGTNFFQFLALIFQSLVQQKVLARIMVIQWAGRLALLLLMLSMSSSVGLEIALYIIAIPDVIGCILLFISLQQYLNNLCATCPEDVGDNETWPIWKDVGEIIRHNYGYSWLIAPPQGNSMIVITSTFLTSLQIAAYGFFVNLIERIRAYLPLNFMLNLAEPILVAGYVANRDFQDLCRRTNILYTLNFAFLMLLLAWTCAASQPLTNLLTGGKYTEYFFLLPLVIAQVTLGSHNTILQVIVNTVGQSDILTKSGATALAFMTTFAVTFLWLGPMKLITLATPLIFEIGNIVVTIFLLRRAGYMYQWRGIFHFKVVLAATIAFAIAYDVQDHIEGDLYRVLTAGVISTLAFTASCKLLRIISGDDIMSVTRSLRGPAPVQKERMRGPGSQAH